MGRGECEAQRRIARELRPVLAPIFDQCDIGRTLPAASTSFIGRTTDWLFLEGNGHIST